MNPATCRFKAGSEIWSREVADGAHEEVLPVGEDRRQAGGDVAGHEIAVASEVLRDRLQRLLERDPAGGHLAVGIACLRHSVY